MKQHTSRPKITGNNGYVNNYEPFPLVLNVGDYFDWWEMSCLMENFYNVGKHAANDCLFYWMRRMVAAGFIKNSNKARIVAKPFVIESVEDFAPRSAKRRFKGIKFGNYWMNGRESPYIEVNDLLSKHYPKGDNA